MRCQSSVIIHGAHFCRTWLFNTLIVSDDCFWKDNFECHGLREERVSSVSSFSCGALPRRHVWVPQRRWPDVKKWNLHGQSWWRMPFLCHQWLDGQPLSLRSNIIHRGKFLCVNKALGFLISNWSEETSSLNIPIHYWSYSISKAFDHFPWNITLNRK